MNVDDILRKATENPRAIWEAAVQTGCPKLRWYPKDDTGCHLTLEREPCRKGACGQYGCHAFRQRQKVAHKHKPMIFLQFGIARRLT